MISLRINETRLEIFANLASNAHQSMHSPLLFRGLG